MEENKDLVALFERQVQATPEAVALEDETKTLTYAQLETETRLLANRLRSEFGVGKDKLVGILMRKCADYVIASLAALRAGGAFLVLELAYPEKLLGEVIEDAKPAVVLTLESHVNNIKVEVSKVVLDSDKGSKYTSSDTTIPLDNDLDRLAFVSYSSGTTGRPKGIANPHRAAVGSYSLRFQLSNLKPGDRVACNVFFIWEMLRPLLKGATTVAVPDSTSYDPEALPLFLAEKKITDTLMTPTLLATVLARHPSLDLPELKSLWLNGEVVTVDLCNRAKAALPNTRLLNVYSASETHEVAAGEIFGNIGMNGDGAPSASATDGVCPVGPLLDPNNVYILKPESNQRSEPNTIGELCVGGPLLARGYLNLPEQTRSAFVPDPFKSDARMYRTGDSARVLQNGFLEITGRIGGMIKTRGYTVHPGAVEAAILKHLAVRACAVVGHGEGLEKRIVCYYVKDHNEEDQRATFSIEASGHSPGARKVLVHHLAHYMIPAVWIELDSLPTHAVSGKIDTKALPSPPSTRPATPNGAVAVGARQIRLETIVEAWSASLNLPQDAIMGKGYNFFDLGGHSLSLANLAGRLTKSFGFPVPLSALAADASLEGHMAAVTAARDGHLNELQSDLPAVMRSDSILPEDIQIMTPPKVVDHPQTILLTGATGYLGAFLLTSLIRQTSAHIICLVRFPQPSDSCKPQALARIRNNLNDLGLWNDNLLDRIEPLPGNLPQARLGLSEHSFEALAKRVQIIIHAAAAVNLVYPYGALRAANIGGTREILRLAALGGAKLHHVSTNGAFPASDGVAWPEDATIDVEKVVEQIPDGYGQSKWVAEQLVLQAKERGISAEIYRPGTLSGCSESGAANPYDMLNAVIVESIRMGFSPEIEGWRCEMTPVNYVADAIVAMSIEPKEHSDRPSVFHLGEKDPLPASRVFDILDTLGYATKRLPWDDWRTMWHDRMEAKSKSQSEPFTTEILKGGFPTIAALKDVPILDDTRTKPVIEATLGYRRPTIDESLWRTYLRHFYARGWLPFQPKSTTQNVNSFPHDLSRRGRLFGKVAIVTGASSGIGAAVAVALAKEGASVSIAARRQDSLKAVQDKIEQQTGSKKILVVPTDVTKNAQVEKLVADTTSLLGPVDILVSCAGVMYFTMMANVQKEEWERTVDVNCKGLLNCLSSAVPGMLKKGSGHIVAISSDAGRKVFPGLGVYSASKFFVEATLQSLRLETVGSGLKVTAIQPGNVNTELLGMSTDAEAIQKFGEPSGAKVLDPEDVARSIIYAVSQPEHVSVNEILVEPRDEPI